MNGALSKELEALIMSQERSEIKCGKYLSYVWSKLIFGFRPINLIDLKEQYRGNLGDCDIIIIAKVSDGSRECNKAFFWELKAPQCYIFKTDESNKNRLKPSQELTDAENKLLYYYYEHRDDHLFHRRYNLRKDDDVYLGGIIIGRSDKKVKDGIEEEEKERLYQEALDVKQILYERRGMRLMIWNEIQSFLEAVEKPKMEIPLIQEYPSIELSMDRIPENAIVDVEEYVQRK